MSEFSCSYCHSNDEEGGTLKCGGCRKEYCHECWNDVFIHGNRKNCIFCAHRRVYVKCSKCGENIDVKNIVKRCCPCNRQLCAECSESENHGIGICWNVGSDK